MLNFLREVEGYEKDYYIPTKDGRILGNSGITIGIGIDLGQQSEQRLKALGVEDSVIHKLKPAFGVRGEKAIYVKKDLLPLSPEEVLYLSLAIIGDELNVLKVYLEDAYCKLIPEAIIVAMSLFHQFGYKLFKYKTYKQLLQQDYKGLLANLRDFGCNYPTRRNKEADLLENGLRKRGLL